jgi:hypothetical protein
VGLTWPLALDLGRAVPLGNNDLWQNYWNFWWWKTALLERHDLPGHTDLIYQPGEASLAFHTHSPANVLSMLPVSALWNEAAALGLATLLGFVLSGWGGFLLTRELTREPCAALAGGLILAFTPHHFEQSLEHVDLASYQCMPFFLLFLVRTLWGSGGRRPAVLTGAFFALNALYSWHSGLLMVPGAAILAGAALIRPSRPRRLIARDLALAGAVAAAIVLPFVWQMASEILRGGAYMKPVPEKGIDLLFLFVPAENHPLWGGAVSPLYAAHRSYMAAGFTSYLSLVALALALAGTWDGCRPRRGGGPGSAPPATRDSAPGPAAPVWWLFFGVYIVLALGDRPLIAGREIAIPLPFALLEDIPIFRALRVANRFVVPAVLALSVLAAFGARAVLAGRSPASRRARFGGIATFLVLDLLWVPYPTRPLPRPDWTAAVRGAPPGLVLDVPGGHRARGAEDMYYQTLHGRRLVGGYTSVVPPLMEARVEEFPFLQLAFISEEVLQLEIDVEAELRRVLDALDISTVVVHLDRRTERLVELAALARGTPRARLYNPSRGLSGKRLDEVRAALRKLWGAPRHADETAEVWTRP